MGKISIKNTGKTPRQTQQQNDLLLEQNHDHFCPVTKSAPLNQRVNRRRIAGAQLKGLVTQCEPYIHPRFIAHNELLISLLSLEKQGANIETIGFSSAGRPIHDITIGEGPKTIAVVTGAHADEPTGTQTILSLSQFLLNSPEGQALQTAFTFKFIPMANPDGTTDNQAWFEDAEAGLRPFEHFTRVKRAKPGEDVEFAYRLDGGNTAENEVLHQWFQKLGSIEHYVSLHSMVVGGGTLFLSHQSETTPVPERIQVLLRSVEDQKMALSQRDRCGQKGFRLLQPGLQTAPTKAAMASFFEQTGRLEVAEAFGHSSMEMATYFGDAKTAIVTEIPLCYCPALSDTTPLNISRKELEINFAHRLIESAERLHSSVSTEVQPYLTPFLSHITGYADTLKHDTARYPDTLATVGDRSDHDMQLLRRQITVLRKLLKQHRDDLDDRDINQLQSMLQDDEAQFLTQFEPTYPSISEQIRKQLAAILCGIF